ncbi:MAG: hypothetical protein IPM29_24940 [Planctomycetes bacterium]|nr:hypothetical protein [Planctomycetota bacterium]
MSYPLALLLTLAVEVPLVCAVAGRRRWPDALGANLLSHPLAWLAVSRGVAGFWPVEAAVISLEAVVYRAVTRLPYRRALGASALANGATIAIALLLSR